VKQTLPFGRSNRIERSCKNKPKKQTKELSRTEEECEEKDHRCGWQREMVTELCRELQRHSRTSQASSPIRRVRRWRLLPSPMPALSSPLSLVAWASPSSSPRWITLPRYSTPSLRIVRLNRFIIYFSLDAVCCDSFWNGSWLIVWYGDGRFMIWLRRRSLFRAYTLWLSWMSVVALSRREVATRGIFSEWSADLTWSEYSLSRF